MDKPETRQLRLCAPLYYTPLKDILPFPPPADQADGRELLFAFDLDAGIAQRIDVEAAHFLGEPVFCGGRSPAGTETGIVFPAGDYLFAQVRRLLDRDETVFLAMEVQKDGLWERKTLGNRIYLRRLPEDGTPVTQIFRPVVVVRY